jgi:U3 small nucleolar RNA-associated protein 24
VSQRRPESSPRFVKGVSNQKLLPYANSNQVKRVLGRRDDRIKENQKKKELAEKSKVKKTIDGEVIREIPQMPSSMFFQYNTSLVPPYNVLVDTNFLSHTVQRKLPLLETMMDCLYGEYLSIL